MTITLGRTSGPVTVAERHFPGGVKRRVRAFRSVARPAGIATLGSLDVLLPPSRFEAWSLLLTRGEAELDPIPDAAGAALQA